MLACDYNFLVGVDSVAEYFVMSGDAEEDSLLGRETEGLIGKLAAIFIDGAEGAYGWDLADVGFAMLATTPAVPLSFLFACGLSAGAFRVGLEPFQPT